MFRALKAEEIDVRVATIKEKGLSLLLYKDARCDMNILDETVGAFNWERIHLRDNANCIVRIYDKENKRFVSKEDTGAESYTEKEKGLASDSFKRACFNWGIGRELYTAPFIWVTSDRCKIIQGMNGKFACHDKFIVSYINIENHVIKGLEIINASTQKAVFRFGKIEYSDDAKEKITDENFAVTEYCTEEQIAELEKLGIKRDNSVMLETLGVKKIEKVPFDFMKKLIEKKRAEFLEGEKENVK